MYILKKLLSACNTFFLIGILCSSCASTRKQEDTPYLQYNTWDLAFSFNYPEKWYVFETNDGLQISNNAQLLANPEAQLPGTFLKYFSSSIFRGTLYFTDLEEFKKVYVDFQNTFIHNIEDVKKNSIVSLAQLQTFSPTLKQSKIRELQDVYNNAFLENISKEARGTYFGDTLIIAELKTVKRAGENVVFVSLTGVFLLEKDFRVGYLGEYDTGIKVTNGSTSQDMWNKPYFLEDFHLISHIQDIIMLMRSAKRIKT